MVLITGVALGYMVVLVGGGLFYRRLLYPAPLDFSSRTPDQARLLEAPTSDGAHVRATLFDGPPGAPIVVHFHGNGETSGDNLWVADELHKRGLGVALVEYRGYGLSRAEPPPTESGLYADAAAALDALEAAGYGRERVVLWGYSLGSGVAAEMALRGRAGALVLVSPYTSIVDMARRIAPRGIPVGLIVQDRYDTLAKAGRIAIPALVVHGDADEFIPHAMGERVAKALPHAILYTVYGGHHVDVVAVGAAGVFDAVAKLARDLVAHESGEKVLAAPTTGTASTAPSVGPSAPDPVSCKTDADCWLDEQNRPMRRPENRRGATRVPREGRSVPECRGGVCRASTPFSY
jgi:uncharacterized protein